MTERNHESDYHLIDAGDARRLERFGARIVDRPSPASTSPRRDQQAWSAADLVFDRRLGWRSAEGEPEAWVIELEGLRFELRPTPAGQVGIFPEQAPTWAWIRRQVEVRAQRGEAPRLLNLFAYTGAATLVAAAAGAAVTHVDASRPSVAWARHNATLSGLAERPIRWIVEDVETWVRRERRRGVRYDGIVLDPPSYGHGRRTWRLEEHLPDLLVGCAAILADRPFVALTAHTPGHGSDVLAGMLAAAVARPLREIDAGPLDLVAASGAHLALGSFARWPR